MICKKFKSIYRISRDGSQDGKAGLRQYIPVGKIAEKAGKVVGVCFLTTWHCILSHTPSDCFFGDFAHWD